MPLKSGELEKFELALQQPKLEAATHEEIKQAIRYAMLLVGVRTNTINAMAEEEKMLLIEFVKEKFGVHTISEIRLAFTKAAAHELDLKEVNHFENFTCEYFGRVMQAYRKWASEKHHELRNLEYKRQEWESLPNSEKYDGLELVEIYYQEFLTDKFNPDLATDIVFATIKKEFNLTYTEEQKNEYLQTSYKKAISKVEGDLSRFSEFGSSSYIHGHLKRDLQILKNTRDLMEHRTVKKGAFILAVIDFFKMLKEKNITSVYDYKPE